MVKLMAVLVITLAKQKYGLPFKSWCCQTADSFRCTGSPMYRCVILRVCYNEAVHQRQNYINGNCNREKASKEKSTRRRERGRAERKEDTKKKVDKKIRTVKDEKTYRRTTEYKRRKQLNQTSPASSTALSNPGKSSLRVLRLFLTVFSDCVLQRSGEKG